jgi:phage tail sheath gpL-like
VEITIGIQNIGRELVIETDEAADAVAQRVAAAVDAGTHLELTDSKGRRVIVAATAIGYVELGFEEQRKVGFGTL